MGINIKINGKLFELITTGSIEPIPGASKASAIVKVVEDPTYRHSVGKVQIFMADEQNNNINKI